MRNKCDYYEMNHFLFNQYEQNFLLLLYYRYGSQASDATQNTLVTVGNLAMTTHNINNMGVKAIVKSTAKATGKAVVMEYEESKVSFNKEGDLKNGNVCKENGETSENPTFKQASPK